MCVSGQIAQVRGIIYGCKLNKKVSAKMRDSGARRGMSDIAFLFFSSVLF